MKTQRIIYFDYLRIFSSFAVMLLHVSAQNWASVKVNEFDWQVFNFYNSMVRWSVPVFIMISGALFLNKNIDVKSICRKYVIRLIVAFFVWAIIYVLFTDLPIIDRIILIIKGHYHMWFIPMIAGLYLCVPFIKPFIQDKNLTKYYLLLALLFTFTIPQFIAIAKDFGGTALIKGSSAFNECLDNMYLDITSGFICYFILGYYLNKTELHKKQRIFIYVLGLLGFGLTIGLSLVVSLKTKQPCDTYYDNFTVNVLFESIAVFTWFKYKKFHFSKITSFIYKLSKYSFGAYLVHVLILEQMYFHYGLNTLSFDPIFSVVCIAIFDFICSFLLSGILNQIPIIKKYIV